MPRAIPVGDRTVYAINDGHLRVPAAYFDDPTVLDRLADSEGVFESPVGAFLWPGEPPILIDAGVGPVDYGGRGDLVGGQLVPELESLGIETRSVAAVALSHLHPDHVGWIASATGEPTFPDATVHVARADWQHFLVDHPDQLDAHIARALQALHRQGQVELVEGEREIAPGLRLVPAPGHTPGHSVFALEDAGDRLLLLGDAIMCPFQLTEQDFSVISDLDQEAARRTRRLLAEDLRRHNTRGVGCHFPGLLAGRLIGNRWLEDAMAEIDDKETSS